MIIDSKNHVILFMIQLQHSIIRRETQKEVAGGGANGEKGDFRR